MDIRTYIQTSDPKTTLTQLAGSLGVGLSTLHDYSTGRRAVPLRVALDIERVTCGKVTTRDLASTREGFLGRSAAAA